LLNNKKPTKIVNCQKHTEHGELFWIGRGGAAFTFGAKQNEWPNKDSIAFVEQNDNP
jgi:hypothetical protein